MSEPYKAVTLIIKKTPPSLNDTKDWHWTKRQEEQAAWDLLIHKLWVQGDKFSFKKPVKIRYILRFETKQARDVDNYIGGTKLINDSLKRSFLTRDDAEWVREVSVVFDKELGSPRTQVEIEEV